MGPPLTKLTKLLWLHLQTSPGLLPLSAIIHCIFNSFTPTTFVFLDSSQVSPYSASPRLAPWGFPPWPALSFWTDLDRAPTSLGSQRTEWEGSGVSLKSQHSIPHLRSGLKVGAPLPLSAVLPSAALITGLSVSSCRHCVLH